MLGLQFISYQDWVYPNKSQINFRKVNSYPYYHPVTTYDRQISKITRKAVYTKENIHKKREDLVLNYSKKEEKVVFDENSWEIIDF